MIPPTPRTDSSYLRQQGIGIFTPTQSKVRGWRLLYVYVYVYVHVHVHVYVYVYGLFSHHLLLEATHTCVSD